jgi:hypothetical protein
MLVLARRCGQRRATQGAGMNSGAENCKPRGPADFCLTCLLTSGAMLLAIGASFRLAGHRLRRPVLARGRRRHGWLRHLILPAGCQSGLPQNDPRRQPADLCRGGRRHAARGAAGPCRRASRRWSHGGRGTTAGAFRPECPAQRAGTGLGHADGAGGRPRPLCRGHWHWRCIPPACSAACLPRPWKTPRPRPKPACARRAPAARSLSSTACCRWSGRRSSPTACIGWR